MRISLSRRFIFVGLIFLFLSFAQQSAFAHTELVSATPAADSVVTVSPKKITLEFSEALLVLSDKETSSISVTSPSGTEISIGRTTVNGSELSVSVQDVKEDGLFEVQWRAVADDGHPVNGKYSYSVSLKADVTPEPSISATTVAVSESSSSIAEILIIGFIILIGLGLLILRWRRNSSD